ncbi:glutathione S-transferase C-terminal domain-containing protein [Sphingomonas panni]
MDRGAGVAAAGRASLRRASGTQPPRADPRAGYRRRHGADPIAGDSRLAGRGASAPTPVPRRAAGARPRDGAGAGDRRRHPPDRQSARAARLESQFAADAAAKAEWYRHWIAEGLGALEAAAPSDGFFGGGAPGVVDCCLVPQLYNARRFELDLSPWPRLVAIDARAADLPAVAAAHPDAVAPVA